MPLWEQRAYLLAACVTGIVFFGAFLFRSLRSGPPGPRGGGQFTAWK